MKQQAQEKFAFETKVITDIEEILDILINFKKTKSLIEEQNDQISISVGDEFVMNLKDRSNPTYDIKLNSI